MGTLRFNFGLWNGSIGLIEKQYSAPVGLVGSFMFNIDVRRASGGLIKFNIELPKVSDGFIKVED